MYTLISETESKRTYKSSITGTELCTTLLHTDSNNAKWWSFEDLLQIPFIRKKAAEKFTQLYGAGITKEDLSKFVNTLKDILKGNDVEKYEKAYTELLNMEVIISEVTDPVKQSLGLCCVYVLADDEQIDTFSFNAAIGKMKVWEDNPELQSFFLNWLTDGMNAYTKLSASLSQIASMMEK